MPKASQKGKTRDSFIWTDDDVELLLHIVNEYKVKKAEESVDWQSCQSKYANILSTFQKEYPSKENAENIRTVYPHSVNGVRKIFNVDIKARL